MTTARSTPHVTPITPRVTRSPRIPTGRDLTPVEDMYTFYEEIVAAALVTQSFPHLKARLEVGRLKLRNRYVQAPFAVQSLAVIRELGLDRQRINPSGAKARP
jgi:hypothetical protein